MTSTPLQKRKSPDKELPRDPRVSAIQEGQVSKRTKLFKRKPIKFCPETMPVPVTVPAHVSTKVSVSVKVQASVTATLPVSAPLPKTAPLPKNKTTKSPKNKTAPASATVSVPLKVSTPVPTTSSSTSTSDIEKPIDKTNNHDKSDTNKVSEAGPRKLESPSSSSDVINREIKTRDVGTQTDDLFEFPPVDAVESTINRLCDKIKSLEAQIQTNSQLIETMNMEVSDSDDDDDDDDVEEVIPSKDRKAANISTDTNDTFNEDLDGGRGSRAKNKSGPNRAGVKSTKVLTNRNTNTDANDMVSIGYGHAKIPARIFRHINWNSYTSATRKLLTAVFSRRVLATHSLTGKPSPAFPLKPPKERLNADIVNDIVQTVVDRCNVPENVVRTSITTKCADESKMFRTRQQNKKKRKQKVNRENIPPDSESDSQ
ncbi:uncharacterized protein LOC142979389 isoform X2 [Anticarsia gemmatalis]